MNAVSREGRTVLFVSHNMGAIRQLCKTALWLDKGHIQKKGTTEEVVCAYEDSALAHFDEHSPVSERARDAIKNISFYFTRATLLDESGNRTNLFNYNSKLTLLLETDGVPIADTYNVAFYIYNELGTLVSVGASGVYHHVYFNKTTRSIKIEIGPLTLTSGKYKISLSLLFGVTHYDAWEQAIGFSIVKCQPFVTSWEMPTFREGACVLPQSFQGLD